MKFGSWSENENSTGATVLFSFGSVSRPWEKLLLIGLAAQRIIFVWLVHPSGYAARLFFPARSFSLGINVKRCAHPVWLIHEPAGDR